MPKRILSEIEKRNNKAEKATNEFIGYVEDFLKSKNGGKVAPEWGCSLMLLREYYKQFVLLTNEIDKLDDIVVPSRYGMVPSPLFAARDKAAMRLEQAMKQFGITFKESIKMDLLEMIQEGTDPFEIIYAVARYLETASAERGYAQHVIDNIRTIYGTALGEQKPLADEIAALESRRQRIQDYLDSTKKDDTVSEEERARLNFSIKAHERKIKRLKGLLQCKA